MCPGFDLYWTDPAQHLATAGEELNDPPYTANSANSADSGNSGNSGNSADTERYVFGKLPARCSQRQPLWHRQYIPAAETSTMDSVMFTVVARLMK